MEKCKAQVFKTSLMGKSVAVLCGLAGNQFLFSNENKLVTVWWPTSLRKLLGECISTTGGVEGLQMRKMVSYFVSPDAFTKLYIQTMDIVSQQHINTHWQGKEELKALEAIKLYTFELACRLFMSIEEPTQIGKLAALFNVFVSRIISIPLDFPGTRFYNAKRATAAIKKELQIIVRPRGEASEQKTVTPSQVLLSRLLVSPDENGKFMSESVIINHVLLLLFAGHDTSSNTITMLIKALAENPQVYDEVLRGPSVLSLHIGVSYFHFKFLLVSPSFHYFVSFVQCTPQSVNCNISALFSSELCTEPTCYFVASQKPEPKIYP